MRAVRNGTSFAMGQPINPKLCENQMEGGMGMGIGGILYDKILSEEWVTVNPNFIDDKFPSRMGVLAARML